jgi:hypothetical protein
LIDCIPKISLLGYLSVQNRMEFSGGSVWTFQQHRVCVVGGGGGGGEWVVVVSGW